MITLKDAVTRINAELGTYYSCASRSKRLHEFGSMWPGIKGTKISGRWLIDETELNDAISTYKSQKAELSAKQQANTADYDQHILNPNGAETTWGSYSVREGFHCESHSYIDNGRSETYQSWICSNCWSPASTEHSGAECHRCSDWSPCGYDCTLSRVYCAPCGTGIDV
jgi:hypothetical protein